MKFGVDRLILMLRPKDIGSNDLFNMPVPALYDLFSIDSNNCKSKYTLGKYELIKKKNYEDRNFFKLKYSLSIKGILVGDLYMDSVDYKAYGYIKFIINKEELYLSDWSKRLNEFLDNFDLEINNVSYIEIFGDTNNNLPDKYYKYLKNEKDFHYYQNRKLQKERILHNFEDVVSGEKQTIYIGNKNSRQLKIYNKSNELRKSGDKFITAFHSYYGLDISKPVYRYELKLTNKVMKQYKSEDDKTKIVDYNKSIVDAIKKGIITKQSFLIEIIKHYQNNIFEFRHRDNDHQSRCTSVDFLELCNLANNNVTSDYSFKPVITTKPRTKKSQEYKIKKQIKEYYQEYLENNTKIYYEFAKVLAIDNGLRDWFDTIDTVYVHPTPDKTVCLFSPN